MQQRNQAVVRVRGAAQRRLVGRVATQGGVVMEAAAQYHRIITCAMPYGPTHRMD